MQKIFIYIKNIDTLSGKLWEIDRYVEYYLPSEKKNSPVFVIRAKKL